MEPMLIPWMLTRKRQQQNPVDFLSKEIPLTKKPKLSTSTMEEKKVKPQFRLVSFCTRDLAEMSRMIFAYAGIEFDNFTMHDNKELVPKQYDIHSHGFPILDWNGKNIYGNDAIARMLAKMYGLAGHGIFEEAQVDTIIGLERELANGVINYVKAFYGFKDINIKKTYAEEFEPAVNKFLGILETYASRSHENGFFFSSGVTYADFAVTNMYELLHSVQPEMMTQFQNISRIKQRVLAIPQLQPYLKSRLSLQEIMECTAKMKTEYEIKACPTHNKELTYYNPKKEAPCCKNFHICTLEKNAY